MGGNLKSVSSRIYYIVVTVPTEPCPRVADHCVISFTEVTQVLITCEVTYNFGRSVHQSVLATGREGLLIIRVSGAEGLRPPSFLVLVNAKTPSIERLPHFY